MATKGLIPVSTLFTTLHLSISKVLKIKDFFLIFRSHATAEVANKGDDFVAVLKYYLVGFLFLVEDITDVGAGFFD